MWLYHQLRLRLVCSSDASFELAPGASVVHACSCSVMQVEQVKPVQEREFRVSRSRCSGWLHRHPSIRSRLELSCVMMIPLGPMFRGEKYSFPFSFHLGHPPSGPSSELWFLCPSPPLTDSIGLSLKSQNLLRSRLSRMPHLIITRSGWDPSRRLRLLMLDVSRLSFCLCYPGCHKGSGSPAIPASSLRHTCLLQQVSRYLGSF